MSLCRLCAGNSNDHPSSPIPPTDTSLSIDEMLRIFRDLPNAVIDKTPRYTCHACQAELTFCYKFYSKVLTASRALAKPSTLELQSFRKIAPKPHNDAGTTDKTINKSARKRRYRCEECSCEFSSYRQLRNHHKTHEVENVCPYCSTFFFDGETLHAHLQEHHVHTKYECSKCEKRYPSRNLLFRHLKRFHQSTNQEEYRCNECKNLPIIFQGRSSIENHIKTTHPDFRKQPGVSNDHEQAEDDIEPDMIEEFLDDMDEEFLDEFLLNQDQNSFCWDDFSLAHFDDELQALTPRSDLRQNGRYKCPRCSEPFQAQQSLIQHLAHSHDESVLICNTCGLSFNRYSKLRQHCATHLAKESLRINHKDGTLPPTSSLQCSDCNRRYKTLAGLKYHLQVHSAAKPFTCPYCQKAFSASTNMNAHIRNIHAEIKPNLCSLCDRKFASLDHLKKHVMSVHQKERNHLCSVCGKSFSQASHLTQHSRIHSGKKQFQCGECGAEFFKNCDLRRHVEKSHKCNNAPR